MHQVFEALIDEEGHVTLREPPRFISTRRALVIVLNETIMLPSPAPVSTQVDRRAGIAPQARYRLGHCLGRGGMGETYLGEDTQTGQSVCIKRLHRHVPSHMIEHELRSLSRIMSPYVVRYLDRYESDGALHVVMEYIDGETLGDRLQRGFSPDETVWLGLALMRGLQAFHELQVIHCDLKPLNVLLEESTTILRRRYPWIPKIIDFGIAVLDRYDADSQLTAEGRIAGTPVYMAPEQVNGLELTPACDVYAVGLILWEALCGRRAFTGTSTAIMWEKRDQAEGLALEGAPPVPPALSELILRCTHPDPARRPTAAEAVACLETLEEMIIGRSTPDSASC